MSLTILIQILAACIGVVGSLFFAVGVMRQSVEAMGRLSGSYWDSNPHMPPMLAAQKADYLFGGCLIVLAFAVQFASFLVSDKCMILNSKQAQLAPWVAAASTAVVFVLLRLASHRVARYYEVQINEWLKKRITP
ncbi:MAG TPA: hypothetical protein VIF82_14790 [Burkholderiaceae bacterium]|jgi:hypothetical protein